MISPFRAANEVMQHWTGRQGKVNGNEGEKVWFFPDLFLRQPGGVF
jgi:hypothetical protein